MGLAIPAIYMFSFFMCDTGWEGLLLSAVLMDVYRQHTAWSLAQVCLYH